MRLIDADSLIKDLQKSRKYHAQNSRESELLRRCENIVCAQQTAYDVEKVVEWLEERKNYLLKEFVLAEKAREVKEKSLARINEIDEVIENVKAGGTDEN